jgi:hypothetical protein
MKLPKINNSTEAQRVMEKFVIIVLGRAFQGKDGNSVWW